MFNVLINYYLKYKNDRSQTMNEIKLNFRFMLRPLLRLPEHIIFLVLFFRMREQCGSLSLQT